MNRFFLMILGIFLSAPIANAFDVKSKTLQTTSELASGKSAKEVAEENKKELETKAKQKVQKGKEQVSKKKEELKEKAMKKADDKTGGAASAIGEALKK